MTEVDEPIALVWCGPAEHGISQLAAAVAGVAAAGGFTGPCRWEPDPARLESLVDRLPAGVRVVHLHVNDWLFKDATTTAEDRIAAFAGALRARGAALVLTLHDLPHQQVTPELYRRRVHTYAAICAQAASVIVSSDHEHTLLRQTLAAAGRPLSTPVLLLPQPIGPVRRTQRPTMPGARPLIGIFGFLYPGKGHVDVIQELAGLPVDVVAIGRASDGHPELVDELRALADRSGVGFAATGYVADDEVPAWLGRIDVPVAPAAQISASGSINSWLAGGRRPLVRDGSYARELVERNPGSVRLYGPGQLRAAVLEALADPALTMLPDEVELSPTIEQVAQRQLEWLRQSLASA